MSSANQDKDSIIRISLCGDVMTGRGIDQILAKPGDPQLWEWFAKDAEDYVKLAMKKNGPFKFPVNDSYIWGDALDLWKQASPDVKIVNLETSITTGGDFWPEKSVHYRMNPKNIGTIRVAGIDGCVVANNHVLDFDRKGLKETLRTLHENRIKTAGAGTNLAAAKSPAAFEIKGTGRVLLFAFGHWSSGIPEEWAAKRGRSGLHLLPDLSKTQIELIRKDVETHKRPGDVVVASIHWGSNWRYGVSPEETAFAHGLIDNASVDMVFGHSSHHVKRMELYQDKLILYGAGDFLTDYEGIRGHGEFRGDLGLLYIVSLDSKSGQLVDLQMFPTQMRQMQVRHATASDTRLIANIINRESKAFGIDVVTEDTDVGATIRLMKPDRKEKTQK